MTPLELFVTPQLLEEYRRLAALPQPPAVLEDLDKPTFKFRWTCDTWLKRMMRGGVDVASLVAGTAWLKEGPKVAVLGSEQYQALCNVEIRLEVKDVAMPYPTVLVVPPPDTPYRASIVHKIGEHCIVLVNYSRTMMDDIVFIVRQRDGVHVEETLRQFSDCNTETRGPAFLIHEEEKEPSKRASRSALNMVLALAHFGHVSCPLRPKEMERDRHLGHEQTERGQRARQRVREHPRLISFKQEVILTAKASKRCDHTAQAGSQPTGREMCFHWRRGHWAMVPCGSGRAERRRVFRRPCMVRRDLLTVAEADTQATYRVEGP